MRERMLRGVCANAGTEDRCSQDCETQRQSRVVWSLGRGLKLRASRSLAIFALLFCPWPLRAGEVRRHLVQTSKGHGETGQRGGRAPPTMQHCFLVVSRPLVSKNKVGTPRLGTWGNRQKGRPGARLQ